MKLLAKLLFGLVAAVLLVTAPLGSVWAQPKPASEEISSFAVEAWIRDDGYVDVTETISYYFPAPRHGIYRDLPLVYENEDGEQYTMPLSDVTVAGHDFTQERNGNWLRLKIGDADSTVTGPQTYVIKYRVEGAIGYFSDHDELYWNATGTEWKVQIRKAAATIHPPSGVAGGDLQLKCFTGAHGSTAEDCLKNVSGNTAKFSANDTLTVVVGFPKGAVAVLERTKLSPWRHAWPLALPALFGAAFFLLWNRYGKDPKGRGTHVVQYDPPDEQTPGVVGVVVDERVHSKDVSATIVDLAVRGHLKIREIEKKGIIRTSVDYELVKLDGGKDQRPLRRYETELMDAIFDSGSTVTISELKKDHSLFKAMKKINKAMYEEAAGQGYFPGNPNRIRARLLAISFAALFLLIFFGSWFSSLFGKVLTLSGANDGFLAIAGVIVLVEFIVFGYSIPRRTEKGVLAKEHAEGFKDYLATAEKYRLEWQEKEGIFERFLPYAMVFGVTEKWSEAFKDMGLENPDWYEGRPGTAFSAVALGNSMSSLGSAMTTAMRSSPQKSGSGSGFGGGGFSGGGGGGGGGGSW